MLPFSRKSTSKTLYSHPPKLAMTFALDRSTFALKTGPCPPLGSYFFVFRIVLGEMLQDLIPTCLKFTLEALILFS